MNQVKITPVILAGGTGTRLWPISREDTPKQFCRLGLEHSLFQKSILRVACTSRFNPPVIVTGSRYAELAQQQLAEIDQEAGAIICEPQGKDTAAAIALACEIVEKDDNQLMLVMPSDHLMDDEQAFLDAVAEAAQNALSEDLIVTFGIKPTHPETGFGYLRAGDSLYESNVCRLESFIEKPTRDHADRLLQNPKVLWNAGIFLFANSVVCREFSDNNATLFAGVCKSVSRGKWAGRKFYPDAKTFADIPAISFDYAIMEKTKRAAVIPVEPKWSDLGSWKAMWETSERDDASNTVSDHCYVEDTCDSFIHSEGPVVAVSGLSDVVVVATKDAVLVTSRENPQGVKKLVENMKADECSAATVHPGADHPWGRMESLDRSDEHHVKRIHLDAGARHSSHYHHHRSEHWVIVKGIATVTIEDTVQELKAGEQTCIPQGAVHSLANDTNEPVEIIEVQTGQYLGEDDLIPVEDKPTHKAA